MENGQQTQNFFFEKISTSFKESTPEKVVNELNKILTQNGKDLSIRQYELIGSLGYLTGIDFTSQSEGYTSTVLGNVTKRFEAVNLTHEVWVAFVAVLNVLHIDELIKPKELMKASVKSVINSSSELIKIKHEMNTVLKANLIPIKFAANIDEFLKSKSLTYINLLNFNSMVYEQMPLNGSSIDGVLKMFSNPFFTDLMKKATDYFDNQKYAIIYFDSLITLLEFNGHIKIETDVLFNQELMNALLVDENALKEQAIAIMGKIDAEVAEVENAAEMNPIEKQEISIENTDYFLKASLEESFEKKIESAEDLLAAFSICIADEDLMQHLYKYLRANVAINRVDFDKVYPFSLDSANEKIAEFLDTNIGNYNTLVLKYIAVIPEDIQLRIVNTINATIKSLSIINSEAKGYLIQQVYENQITTYKQLHQTVELIEACEIHGSKLNNYIALRDMILYSDDIVNIFEESIVLEDMKLKIQFFTAVKEFFKPETVTNPAN